eukprot:6212705-Pleurochrysis_carterae.AAC.3
MRSANDFVFLMRTAAVPGLSGSLSVGVRWRPFVDHANEGIAPSLSLLSATPRLIPPRLSLLCVVVNLCARAHMYMHACVRTCVPSCVRACLRACVGCLRACVLTSGRLFCEWMCAFAHEDLATSLRVSVCACLRDRGNGGRKRKERRVLSPDRVLCASPTLTFAVPRSCLGLSCSR